MRAILVMTVLVLVACGGEPAGESVEPQRDAAAAQAGAGEHETGVSHRRVDVTLTEGTNMAVALDQDGRRVIVPVSMPSMQYQGQ